jgi:DNA-directed RNA polymerase subunit RPC12/RpoP
MQNMATFLIVVCSRCGGFLLAKTEQKTRTCPYCGFKVGIINAKKAASAETALEASEILRKLKRDAGLKKKNF